MFNSLYITGSLAWDVIMNFPGEFKDHFHPEKLHNINISFAVNTLERRVGGTATDITYSAAHVLNLFKFKVPVSIFGAIGKDGDEHLKLLRKLGVNVNNVLKDKKLYSATGSVITDKTDNQIWGFHYGASENAKNCTLPVANKTVRPLLVISANHPKGFLHFQSEAIKKHIPYLYDFGMSLTFISNEDLHRGVLNSWGVVGNDYEISMLCKRLGLTVTDILKENKIVITTLGAEGVWYQYKNEKVQLTSFKTNLIDPTGAGDAWRGAFCAGLTMGYEVKHALALGNAVASFCIEHNGCISYTLKKKDLDIRVKSIINNSK